MGSILLLLKSELDPRWKESTYFKQKANSVETKKAPSSFASKYHMPKVFQVKKFADVAK